MSNHCSVQCSDKYFAVPFAVAESFVVAVESSAVAAAAVCYSSAAVAAVRTVVDAGCCRTAVGCWAVGSGALCWVVAAVAGGGWSTGCCRSSCLGLIGLVFLRNCFAVCLTAAGPNLKQTNQLNKYFEAVAWMKQYLNDL